VKLWYLLPSWDTSFWFHGEVRGDEWHERRVLRTSAGGSRICVNGKLAWYFELHSIGMRVGVLA
jgi:acyl-CoA thioesterase